MVGIIVPSQEVVADGARVFECAEPLRKLRPIREGAKLRLRERIVIAHARPRVAGRDAEVGEQQRDELAAHGRAAVGVNRELLRLDALLRAGLLDQALGQVGALLDRHHPAHDVAAEEVEDHIQRVVERGNRALQLGDVPGPDLIRRRRDELGFDVRRMPHLVAALPHFVGLGEHPIHRARGAEVGLLLKQRRIDFGGRLIDKPRAVQRVADGSPFGTGPARAATARGAAGASPAAWAGAADRATRGTRRCSDTTPTSRPSP